MIKYKLCAWHSPKFFCPNSRELNAVECSTERMVNKKNIESVFSENSGGKKPKEISLKFLNETYRIQKTRGNSSIA